MSWQEFWNGDPELKLFIAITFLLNALFVFYRTVKTNERIDSYRSELKLNEAKFTLYNRLQVEAMSRFYTLSARLQRKSNDVLRVMKEENRIEYPTTYWKQWQKINNKFNTAFTDYRYIYPSDLQDDVVTLTSVVNKLSHSIDLQFKIERCYKDDGYGDWAYADASQDHARYLSELGEFDYIKNFELSNSALEKIQVKINRRFKEFEKLSA